MIRTPGFLLLLIALAAGEARAQGRLNFETLTHDFGSIAEGRTPTYTFTFTNGGDVPVRLTEVRPACGCTTPAYSTEPVPPGGRGEIVVEYNSQGRPGPFEKSVYVRAEGAEPDNVTLYIVGDVVPASVAQGVPQGNLLFDVDARTFGTLTPDAVVTHTFRVQNSAARPIRIREARAYDPAVTVTIPDRPIFAGQVAEVTVAFNAADIRKDSAGTFDIGVTLMTDDEVRPTKSLVLSGTVRVPGADTADTSLPPGAAGSHDGH